MSTDPAKNLYRPALVIAAGLLLLLSWKGWVYWEDRQERIEAAQQQARGEAERAAEGIEVDLRQVSEAVDALAARVGDGTFERRALVARLRRVLYADPELRMVGLAFAPFQHDPGLRLFSVALVSGAGEPRELDIDSLYDYTRADAGWYEKPLAEGAVWLEPAYEESLQESVVFYAAPFQGPDADTPRGVAFAAVPVSYLDDRLGSLDLGEAGYAYILSADGRYVSHPESEYVRQGLIEDPTRESGPPAVDSGRIPGADRSRDWRANLAERASWTFEEVIPVAGWTLRAVFFEEDILDSPTVLRRDLMQIGLAAAGFGLVFCVVLAGFVRRIETWAWIISSSSAVLFALVIVGTWYLTRTLPDPRYEGQVRITNRASLADFRHEYTRRALDLRDEVPHFVPTGIFIQSIFLEGANNVSVTGYLWQNYYRGLHDDLSRGFVFPEMEAGEITEAFRVDNGDHETVGWYFQVDLRQEFEYSRYPFGQENVWLQLWHQDFHRNVMLIPDIDAYVLMSPSARPGLSEDLVLPGWYVERSFFGYRPKNYMTDFGVEDYAGQESFPELHFNVIIKKHLLGPFVAHLLPLNVILVLVFTLLMLGSKSEDKVDTLGFTARNVIASSAAFLLVAIFAHIDLRQNLQAKEILYLEYFYFTTYFLILGVSVNSLFFARTTWGFFEYRDNLIPKILYWPLSQAMILLITFWHFY